MLKLGGEIEYTQVSILRKNNNDSFHVKNASEKLLSKTGKIAREVILVLFL